MNQYIQAKIEQELAGRLTDQANIVREIADRAEDVVWTRFKRYGWIGSVIILLLGAWGVKSITDAGGKVVDTARQRVEPLVQNLETRAKTAQGSMSALEVSLLSAKENVNDYQRQIQGYQSAITTSGNRTLGEISKLHQTVDRQQAELTQLKGQVLDLGERELRAKRLRTTGPGPSYEAYGALGCPSVSEALTKDGMLVAYCAQGNPLNLFQLTTTELRPVSSRSPIGFQDVSTSPKPACNPATRGTLYVEKGGGSNIPDQPFLCAKKSDSRYEWVQVLRVP